MRKPSLRLGEALVARGALSDDDVRVALAAQYHMVLAGSTIRLGEVLVHLGLIERPGVEAALREIGCATGRPIAPQPHAPPRQHSVDHLFRQHPEVARCMRDLAGMGAGRGGIILVTGAPGQGKSTTLSALLWAMPRMHLNIMTIEAHVDSRIPFVHHTAATAAGDTYEPLLRACMTQSPDVILVDEIRNAETAREFLLGAANGRTMLSAMHAADVPDAVRRLTAMAPADMRPAAPFVLASCLRAVLNQRLVPALCDCARDDPTVPRRHARLFKLLHHSPGQNWRLRTRKGCDRCKHSGYHGRELVVEAAFFPALHSLKLDIAERLLEDFAEGVLHCDGVQEYTRIDAVRKLLSQGLIDAPTAESALDMRPVARW